MSENIEFVLRMKDMMSGMMPKVANTAQSTFGRVDNSIARTQSHLNNLSKPVKINVDTSSVEKAHGMLGSIVGGTLLAGGIGMAAGAIKHFVGDSLHAAMQYGMQAKSFEVLTGSAKRGRELIGDLRNLKQTTIMGASVYKNAQTMMGFGIGDNEVVKDLRQIGDIAMGDQERMAGLTLAFSQMRASGKLMGQDLLQFINAGFNPLSVMSEKWKEFGFKQKMSVGQLKDSMSEGKISSEMVSKAFELATSKGGKFYNMMEQIGETAGGKMMKMHGNLAALKIDIGNALLPMQNIFTDAASDMLHWIHISKTVPETLMEERMEIDALIGSITKLNEGDALRGSMIDMLKRKYPDLLDGLDTEKLKNEELLSVMQRVNKEYDKKINIASYQLMATESKKELKGWMDMATKAKAESDFEKMNGGKSGGYLNLWDYAKISTSGYASFNISNNSDYLKAFYQDVMNYVLPKVQAQNANYEDITKNLQLNKMIGDASSLMENPDKMHEMWGKDFGKNYTAMTKEMAAWNALIQQTGGKLTGAFRNHDWSNLQRLTAGGNSAENALGQSVGDASSKVTGGGSRPVNITFKNIIENFNNNGASEGERREHMEAVLEESVYKLFKGVPA